MRASNERLTVLSEAEKAAFYECPDFDEAGLNYINEAKANQEFEFAISTKACWCKIG